MIDESVLRPGERLGLSLRSLYCARGFRPYHMSKFEEYDLYARNKEFLLSDQVITFTDTDGKLMALKPDVTLSIVKNTRDGDGAVRKLCYDENVYRVAKGTGTFREIGQAGLECIGGIDGCCVSEVLLLAAESLRQISGGWALAVTHLGILSRVLDEVSPGPEAREELLRCVSARNRHGIAEIFRKAGQAPEKAAVLEALLSAGGSVDEALDRLDAVCGGFGLSEEAGELRSALSVFEGEARRNVQIDFSLTGDLNYYNGILFQGFVSGAPVSVLSGGSYDGLMRRMGRRDRAIGFAVYLDELERLLERPREYDADAVLLYGDGAAPAQVEAAARRLRAEKGSVLCAGSVPAGGRYREIWKLEDGEVIRVGNDA
jgi:ATP phosphoribosyltransferase regulatory subunit